MSLGAAAYGGLSIQDGSTQTQALTTTPGQMVAWSATGGAASSSSSGTRDGNPAIIPDPTNNRIKVLPGVYAIDFDLTMTGGGPVDVIAQVYKNGVAVVDLSARVSVPASGRACASFSGILTVLTTDAPGTLATMNPTTGLFTGGAGAPNTEVPITIQLKTASSTITITIEASHLTLFQVG